jgi:hypothetical protein
MTDQYRISSVFVCETSPVENRRCNPNGKSRLSNAARKRVY